MADFRQIGEAKNLLGLEESATLQEIKKAYRELSLKYHPDKCAGKDKKKCEEMFKKINRANEILMTYCANYRFSFKEEEVKKTTMDKAMYEHMKRFYDGWWGNLDL